MEPEQGPAGALKTQRHREREREGVEQAGRQTDSTGTKQTAEVVVAWSGDVKKRKNM